MRFIIQRVLEASVKIDEKVHASIGHGLLVLAGIEAQDTDEDLNWIVSKLCHMRIFADQSGKMNLDMLQVNGELLLVSQFTLFASTKKGNRPSFTKAAAPETAIPIYETLISALERELGKSVSTGIFGAEMLISSINQGPVTIILDSKQRE
jgi:D-aminoacyl-tRNA deacylase